MDRRWIGIFAVLGSVIGVWSLATFTVPQWEQAVVLQLGEPVRTVRDPGLYFKLPFIQSVIYFDKRLLDYDAAPKELLTRDKQQLVVDNYTRWRIVDPLQFYRAVRNEAGAQSRLDDIVYSNLRENFGRQTLNEIVSAKRAALMSEITSKSDLSSRDYGIEVIDVRIKRADLPEKNELNVFSRMRTERERLAKKFRAEGDEESRKIRSQSDKQVQVLTAEAQKEADILRGQGDAEAVRIFAEAFGRDEEFYEFTRTLEAYRRTLPGTTTVVLSPDSEFFKLLNQGSQPESPPQ
ncbi:MAG: protease modulator HflC [Candidatus Binatia bacterium]|nr:protease modulator HflC [Candidatus Binatia bacterium]